MVPRSARSSILRFLSNISPSRVGIARNSVRWYDSVPIPKAIQSELSYKGIQATEFIDAVKFQDSGNTFPIYQLMDPSSKVAGGGVLPFSVEEGKEMLRCMLTVQAYDKVFYDTQRQARFSFYMTGEGEEATQVGTSAALAKEDLLFLQYREMGTLLWRGFDVDNMLYQCLAIEGDPGKGRQMPVHYTNKKFNFQPISSTLGTQLPHAVGAGFAFAQEQADRIAVAFCGDGSASEGDFAPALNFAAVLGSQTLFICRNNGYAISTPVERQYRGDGIAPRGPAYGVVTARVDGNDLAAVYSATKEARKLVIEKQTPVLLEIMTYRLGHHSTSDDSGSYRCKNEMSRWEKGLHPIDRMKQYFLINDLMKEEEFNEISKTAKAHILARMKHLERSRTHYSVDEMFTDIYDSVPWHLEEQRDGLAELWTTQQVNPKIDKKRFATSQRFPTGGA